MIIDAHHHLWQRARGDYDWLDSRINPALAPIERDYLLEDYRALAAANGIGGSVLVQAAQTEAETRWLLAQAHTGDAPVQGVVGWLDMAAPDAADVLGALAQDRLLRGIRPMLQDIPDVDWVLQPRLDAAFRALLGLDLFVRRADPARASAQLAHPPHALSGSASHRRPLCQARHRAPNVAALGRRHA